ncbi:MAG: hypothetical protein J5769_05165 [Bacteroidales bacterium]|nr:hypothetical protein [Bacteroidales bacterium]
MKRILTIIFVLALMPLAASAQTRTYGDIESKAFVIGLDQYYFGSSGSLTFKAAKKSYEARINGGSVSIVCPDGKETLLYEGEGDFIIGIHDFTGNKKPELVVAGRRSGMLEAEIFQLGDTADPIGRIGAQGEGITEIRVFRQAITIKNHKAGAMYTWTWHKNKFDFKASDGSSDPTPARVEAPAE